MFNQDLVEMTITSCKRLNYFIQSMDSFFENMLDLRMLNRITCCDDHSSDADRAYMQQKYSDIEFIWSDQKGQPYSLRKLFSRLRSTFVLHWEDDFVLAERGEWITKCIRIMMDSDISSVILTPTHGEKRANSGGDYFVKMYEPKVAAACPNNECGYNRYYGQPMNPGFSLNPGLHRVSAIQSIEWPDCKHHEYNFARQYHDAGNRVAYLDRFYVQHIGLHSSFNLNQTER